MMCCALAALLLAVIAASRGMVKSVLTHLTQARWAPGLLAVALVLAGGSALAARHLDHAAPGRADLAAILMSHICGGRPARRPSAHRTERL